MELEQLIEAAGGERSLKKILECSTISAAALNRTITALSPLIIARFKLVMQERSGRNWVRRHRESGGPQQFIDRPGLMDASLTDLEGERLLTYLFGDATAVAQLQSKIAAAADVKSEVLAPVLRRLACLFVGAICKQLAV